jgi:hypothetical protein
MAMRVHITLADDVVRCLDRRVGPRQRSGFIAAALERVLDDEHRWELIESAVGSVDDTGHEWDRDPARWVRAQRRGVAKRVG